MYQYATSMVAAVSLANGITSEPAGKHPAPRRLPHAADVGIVELPDDLLERAGVDMTTSAPFKAAMAEMNRIMDEMDRILTKRPKT